MIMKKISIIQVLLFLLLGSSLSIAQGWQKTLIDNRVWPAIFLLSSEGQAIQETPDGGFLVVGEHGPLQQNVASSLILTKLDANGTIQWQKQDTAKTLFGNVEDYRYSDLLKTNDGNYLAAGYLVSSSVSVVHTDIIFAKLNILGDTLWTKVHDIGINEKIGGIANTADGGFVFTVNEGSNSFLCKIDAQGTLLWNKAVSSSSDEFRGVMETTTGEFVFVGNMATIAKADANGNLLWRQTNPTLVGSGGAASSVTELPDGNYVIGGHGSGIVGYFALIFKTDTSGIPDLNWAPIGGFNAFGIAAITDVETTTDGGILFTGSGPHSGGSPNMGFLAKLDAAGVLTAMTQLNSANNTQGYRAKETSDGGFILVGNNQSGVYVAKTDSSARLPFNTVSGNVYNDLNTNCILDITDAPLTNWIVKITNNSLAGAPTFYATTDSAGNYTIQLDTGLYSIEVHSISPYWQDCLGAQVLNFPQYYVDTTIDFGMQNIINCPLLQVDISSPLLRRCFSSSYYVSYTNLGGADAQNAYVEVELDSFLIYNSSSIPLISQVGQTYRFDIGTVPFGASGNFNINVTVDCDSTILGQTHCVEAHIYPDSICIPNYWTGPILDVTATCFGDSIRFDIINTGSAMPSATQYVIAEDNIIIMFAPLQLGAGGQATIYQAVQAGSAYRMTVDQASNYPSLLGNTTVSVALEGCSPFANGLFNTGFITNMAYDDGSPFVAIDCQQNVGSYDPNDKQAQPVGYSIDHFIEAETALNYKIRFQNTGTDTAFTVRIVDELPTYLDPATVIVGASSHPYTWKLYGENTLEFMFNNINLPDSNVNEPASHGFIKFGIQQKSGNSIGTYIENDAAIYFDYNAPVITNTVFHTIGNNFIITDVDRTFTEVEQIKAIVFPNPMDQYATIKLEGLKEGQKATLLMFDALGQQIEQQVSNVGIFELKNNGWSAGLYIYQIQVDQKSIGSGKIIVK